MTTNSYIQMVYAKKAKPFNKKLWQKNFHEHIIRNKESHQKIRHYIQTNPIKWDEDIFYNDEI